MLKCQVKYMNVEMTNVENKKAPGTDAFDYKLKK
jgi:hypothetical protein